MEVQGAPLHLLGEGQLLHGLHAEAGQDVDGPAAAHGLACGQILALVRGEHEQGLGAHALGLGETLAGLGQLALGVIGDALGRAADHLLLQALAGGQVLHQHGDAPGRGTGAHRAAVQARLGQRFFKNPGQLRSQLGHEAGGHLLAADLQDEPGHD